MDWPGLWCIIRTVEKMNEGNEARDVRPRLRSQSGAVMNVLVCALPQLGGVSLGPDLDQLPRLPQPCRKDVRLVHESDAIALRSKKMAL